MKSHWATGKAAWSPRPASQETCREAFELFGRTEGDSMTTQVVRRPLTLSQRSAAGLASFCLGAFLIFGVGMAQPENLHNAAHDTRHGLGFPCH